MTGDGVHGGGMSGGGMSGLSALTLLYVEDEAALRQQVATYLGLRFGRVLTAANGVEALDLFEREKPDVVVSDIRMPGMDGLELTGKLRERAPTLPVVLCTAFADVSSLLEAIELGVNGVVRKPISLKGLLGAVTRAVEPVVQRREIEALRSERLDLVSRQLGVGSAMRRLAEEATRVAASAYTGAERKRAGLFQTAQGGTLFLDDIDTTPPAIQAKLLTVVETGRFFPFGSSTPLHADVRVIAASNRDLAAEVAAGRFRQDLFYRLGDVVLTIPPLRERPEDVEWLADILLVETSAELGTPPVSITDEALAELKAAPWPGNVRELRSTLRRVILFSDGDVTAGAVRQVLAGDPAPKVPTQGSVPAPPESLLLSDLEAWGVRRALEASGGKRLKTAEALGVTYKTLRAMLDRYGIP